MPPVVVVGGRPPGRLSKETLEECPCCKHVGIWSEKRSELGLLVFLAGGLAFYGTQGPAWQKHTGGWGGGFTADPALVTHVLDMDPT